MSSGAGDGGPDAMLLLLELTSLSVDERRPTDANDSLDAMSSGSGNSRAGSTISAVMDLARGRGTGP